MRRLAAALLWGGQCVPQQTRAFSENRLRCASFLTSLLFSVCAVVQQPGITANQSSTTLDQQVKARIDGFPGKVTLYAKNLDTGVSYGILPDDPVRTASTIKLAIMVECFAEAAEGKLNWTEPLKITDDEKVSGTGLVQDFIDGDELPMRDMLDLMIVVSDNTATNLILNRIGGDAVNARMAQLGFATDSCDAKDSGRWNETESARAALRKKVARPENKNGESAGAVRMTWSRSSKELYRGELVNKSASEEMIAVLKRQRDHDCIGRDMKDVTIASKSGSLDHLRSDVGIIYSKHGPIAMAITVEDIPEIDYTPDNPGDLLISALSEILVDGLGHSLIKIRRCFRRSRCGAHGRILDAELVQVSWIFAWVVIVFPHLGTVDFHGLLVEPERGLILGPHERRVLDVLGLHGAIEIPGLLNDFRMEEQIDHGHGLHFRAGDDALMRDGSGHCDSVCPVVTGEVGDVGGIAKRHGRNVPGDIANVVGAAAHFSLFGNRPAEFVEFGGETLLRNAQFFLQGLR